ncbi:MAG: zinc ribbon domain-containing protein [Candidatus Pacebacteria bacterium]|nr:zinc ribbon domain-containing protein [Candidatus Paceibacterota bacterium]
MPTYEYKCTQCGNRFEVFQQMTDDPLTTCRQCSGELKRLIGSGAGIIFKGSGFYCTDYRSDSYKAGAQSASSSGASGNKDTGKSTPDTASSASSDAGESKPAKKAKEAAHV